MKCGPIHKLYSRDNCPDWAYNSVVRSNTWHFSRSSIVTLEILLMRQVTSLQCRLGGNGAGDGLRRCASNLSHTASLPCLVFSPGCPQTYKLPATSSQAPARRYYCATHSWPPATIAAGEPQQCYPCLHQGHTFKERACLGWKITVRIDWLHLKSCFQTQSYMDIDLCVLTNPVWLLFLRGN